jgi:hypothetical protein
MSDIHLRELEKLAEGGAPLRRLKKLYRDAQTDLERKLAQSAGGTRVTFTVQQQRAFLAMVKQAQIELARNMASNLGQLSSQASRRTLQQLIRKVKRMEKKFANAVVTLPIEEAARFEGILDKNKSSLLKMHATSMSRYGTSLVRKMEQSLGQSLIRGVSIGDAIDAVMEQADIEWWQAERIVRTEQAWAYNATHAAAVEDAAKDLPDMMMRWTELVNDKTGLPLDTRVGADSIAMHGQLAPPGGLFTMPADPDVHRSLQGQSWSHPPNRPNDRSVLQPWRPHWGIPGWILRNGRKVPLRTGT